MATRDKYILEIETEQARRGLNSVDAAAVGLGQRLGGLKTIAAGALAGLGVAKAVGKIGDTITDMDNLAKSAQRVGAAGDEADFQGFQVASRILDEMGLSSEQSDRALDNLNKRLSQAATTGKGQAAASFEKLRDVLTNTDGSLKSLPERFEAVAQAMQDGRADITDARNILGDVVGPIIQGGFERLAANGTSAAEALADVKANSNIISLESAENAEAFGDTLGRLKDVSNSIFTELVSKLLPTLNQLAEGALERLPGIIEGVKNAFQNLEPVFSLIGTVLSELVFPIMQKVFEVLGLIAQAIAPLIDFALPALEAGFNLIATAIGFVIEKITAVLDFFGRVIAKAREMGAAVKEAFNNMTGGIVGKAKDAWQGVTGWFGRMYDDVVGNSFVPDMARDVLSSFDLMGSGMIDSISATIGKVIPAFQNVANSIADRFQQITGISLSSVQNQVQTISNSIFSSISNLASSVSSRLSSIMGSIRNTAGRVGDFFGGFSFSNPFAGFFAKGGFIPKGQFGVVGEAGPELVSGPAQVTPMNQMQPQAVTYNINAVDASSFRSLLARDPSFVHAVVQRGQLIGGRR